MVFDIAIALLLLFFMALGAWRGALASGLGLLALVCAYAAAVVAATQGGELVGRELGMSPLVGTLVAGTVAGCAVFVAFMVMGFFAKRWDEDRLAGDSRGGLDRLFGAIFGGVRGSFVALLVALAASWLDAARDLDPQGPLAAAPDTQDSRAAAVTGLVVETATTAALGDAPGAKVLARVVSRPERLAAIQSLLEHPSILEVQQDRFFWTLIENGSADRALNRMSFYRIAHDGKMRAQLADLGFVSEEAAGDSDRFRDELRPVLDEVGARVKGLRNDPEIRRLASDPEIQQMLQSGNTVGLMTHPGIRRLASRLAGNLENAGAARDDAASASAPEAAAQLAWE